MDIQPKTTVAEYSKKINALESRVSELKNIIREHQRRIELYRTQMHQSCNHEFVVSCSMYEREYVCKNCGLITDE